MADKPPHFLRAWRKSKGYTLERVAEHIGMTHQNLGKIERFEVPYSQGLLEALADYYGTDAGSLIMRDPSSKDPIWTIYDRLAPAKKPTAVSLLDALDKTGTEG